MRTTFARAWRAQFVNPSCTNRYKHVRCSSFKSPVAPTISNVACPPHRRLKSLTCACSAGPNPRSSNNEGRSPTAKSLTIRIVRSANSLASPWCVRNCASSFRNRSSAPNSIRNPVNICPTSSCNSRDNLRRSSSCVRITRADSSRSCSSYSNRAPSKCRIRHTAPMLITIPIASANPTIARTSARNVSCSSPNACNCR